MVDSLTSYMKLRQEMNSSIIRGLFNAIAASGRGKELTTLFLHKVDSGNESATSDLTADNFERLLDFLEEHMNVVPLHEAVAGLKSGSLPPRAVSLTFDDGYSDWTEVISPILRRRNMHATFFVTTEQLDGPDHWNERITNAVERLPPKHIILPFGFGGYSNLNEPGKRALLVEELHARFKYMSLADRKIAIEELERQASASSNSYRRFDVASLRDLHSQGFGIGAHTIHHPILNECDQKEALNEIGGSREILQELLRSPVELFAYPNGKPTRDYSVEHVRMVEQCGYRAAFSTSGGVASNKSDFFQLPRFAPWAFENIRLAHQIAGNFFAKDRRVSKEQLVAPPNNTRVKILLVASTFSPIHGGSAVVYESLCQNLPPDSIRVLSARRNYLNDQEVKGWKEYDKAASFPIHRVDLLRPLMQPPPRNLLVSVYRLLFQDLALSAKVLWQASKLVREHNINIVCIGELVSGSWLGIALKKLFNCQMVIYVHGEEITTATNGRLHGNQRAYYLSKADRIVAVSSFTCDALTRLMNVSPAKISLVHNGVDTQRFSPGTVQDEFIEKYGLIDRQVVLTVGRMVPRKGIDMAIKAIGKISKQLPNIRHLVVGDGPLRNELEKLVEDEGLSDIVTIIGAVSQEELLSFFRVCDLFLLPNRTMEDGDTEGFGLVFREANACGKPVVGGRAGGVVEAVVDGGSGLLVDGTSLDEIANAVYKLLTSDDLRVQIASNGLSLAKNNNTKTAANRFLKICERMLNF